MASASDDTIPSEAPPKVDLALCVDPLSLRRFRDVLRYMCVGMMDAAAAVRLVTSSTEAESLLLGSIQPVYHEELTWPLRQRRLNRLLDALAARPPNIVHGISGRSFGLADVIAHRFDAHLVLHLWGMDELFALAVSKRHPIDHVVAASRPIFDAILEGGAVDRSQMTLVRPGITAGDGPTCFTQPHRIPTVLCTSQLIMVNGVDRLLHALHLVRQRGHDFMAFLTGSGPQEHSLRKTAQAIGLASAVTFAEPLGEAKQIMVGADIFVRPAIEGTISVRSLQAMGSGMALVTIEGGASDGYLSDVTALVCPENDASTLAAAIERLLNDRPFAGELATRAVRHIKGHHSVSVMCDALLQIYYHLALRDRTPSLRS